MKRERLEFSTTIKRHRTTVVLAGILSLLVLAAGYARAQNAEPPTVTPAQKATVYLMQTYSQAGSQVISCIGSGTLVSSTGLVLTNAHLVEAVGPCRGERIVVALSVRAGEPPVPTYLAQIAQADAGLDLAVVQIISGLDGSSIDPNALNLPYVTLGDPSNVSAGTNLTYVGYPDAGESSVAAIDGTVSGTTAEKVGSTGAWLRTAVSLGGVMSGGGAYDANGNLLGVLSSAPGTDGLTPGADCLSIQDNNRDGAINERDACAPVGGAVTAIRPVNFALPLVEASLSGFRLDKTPGIPEPPLSDQPSIKRLFISEGISNQGVPTHIVAALPSGAKSVYVFFDYENMRPGTSYELRVTSEGVEIPGLGLGPLAWGGGRKGTWFIGSEDVPLADGTYDFTLLLAGKPAGAIKLSVGAVSPTPGLGNLSFSTNSGSTAAPLSGLVYPAQQTTQIEASFDYQNLATGQAWTQIWYLDGAEIFRATNLWDKDAQGRSSVTATNVAGLPLGTYRLELLIGDKLAATGDVTLAGNRGPQGQAAAFSNIRIASDRTRDGLPSGQVGSVMPLGINTLYGFMDWDNMPAGLPWTYRWFLDGKLVASSTQAWDNGGVGQNLWVSLTSSQPLPEGTYAVEALVENTPMFSATVSIGSGTRPSGGQQNSADVVSISGTVTDALTGRPIAGALVIVLNVALESPQFTGNEAQIYSEATSDQQGHFILSKALPRGNFYTVYVFADGFSTIVEDTFTVVRTQTSPVEITIQMNRP